jgi:hypothetical protein
MLRIPLGCCSLLHIAELHFDAPSTELNLPFSADVGFESQEETAAIITQLDQMKRLQISAQGRGIALVDCPLRGAQQGFPLTVNPHPFK